MRALLVVAAVCAGILLGVDRHFAMTERILPGVAVAGIPVGGLSPQAAQRKLTAAVPHPTVVRLCPNRAGQPMNLPASAVGVQADIAKAMRQAGGAGRDGNIVARFYGRMMAHRRGLNIPLHVSYSPGALKWALNHTAADRYEHPAVDARICVSGGALYKYRGSDGVEIDVPATLRGAVAFSVHRPTATVDLPVVLKTAHPSIALADLQPIDAELVTFSTRYHTYERDRSYNLMLAAREVSGALVKPGETFSYNQTVGPRLKSKGYRDAKIFVNGRVEDGTGGGICQVSSTLYNAALLAGMKIRQRSHHSMAVHYAPPGLDATVSYGLLDLKFINPLPHAVYIQAYASGGRLVTTFYGAAEDRRSIRIVRKVSAVTPFGTKVVTDSSLRPGRRKVKEKGIHGYTVAVLRITEQGGGKQTVETISHDRYKPHDTLVYVGASHEGKPSVQTPAAGGGEATARPEAKMVPTAL